jgi:two-component system heavy metal sensor histidine kinase CusS
LSDLHDGAGSASTTRWSIAGWLSLWYTASVFTFVAAATLTLYWMLERNIDRQNDHFLVDTVQILRSLLLERPDDPAAFQQEVEWEGAARLYTRLYVRIRDPLGAVVIETPGTSAIMTGAEVPATGLDAEPGPGLDIRSPAGTPYRAVAAWARVGPDGRSRRLIEVALDRTAEQELLRDYRSRFWVVLALALMVSAVAGYGIAHRSIRPIGAITDTARGIRSSTLSARIQTAGLPSELASLAATFNQMLTRLEEAFTRLSGFSADLAHELRTPINNLRGSIEVALGRPRGADEYRAVLESTLEECGRLSLMIDGLMFLARADSPEARLVRAPVDVDRELKAVYELYGPFAAEAGVGLQLEPPPRGALVAPLDRNLFQRAISNLITNALRHTPAGGTVRLAADVVDGALQVDVADTGTGIPPEHLTRVLDRFYRVDPSRSSSSGGLGLGLAIVQSIMKIHAGSLRITSEPGRGTTIRLTFPTAPLSQPQDART